MRLSIVTASALATLAVAAPASASWSPPQSAKASALFTANAAVNARGDAAVAWATLRDTRRRTNPGTSVHVLLRSSAGKLTSHTLWSSHRETADGIAVTIDDRGQVTVAWIATRPAERVKAGTHGTLRAIHGRAGHWSRVQVLGRAATDPRLAVAPNRDVLLTWVGTRTDVARLGVAWRSFRHSFGRVQSLTRPRVKWTPTSPLGSPVPAFDAAGTAYLSGSCDGVVRIAAPRSHRFGAPLTVTDHTVLSLSLSVAGTGRGVVSWVDGGFCNPDIGGEGDRGGPVAARTLAGGTLAPPVALYTGADAAFTTWAVALPDGAGSVSWVARYGTGAHTAQVAPSGAFGADTPAAGNLVAVAADGGADIVLAAGDLPASAPGIRPAGTATIEPPPNGGQMVVAPTGRAAAALASPAGRISLSVWRP